MEVWRLFLPATVSHRLLAMNDESFDEDFDFIEEETEVRLVIVRDPLAPWNKLMYRFNDKLYYWVLKPVSKGYGFVLPQPVRTGIRNFFYNIKAPIRIVSCVLQGKGKKAVAEIEKFVINSTAGVLGFANPVKKYPRLNPSPEDLGQTLGRYGIGNGIYLVWPVLGPSTLRDTFGFAGDQLFLNPVSYVKPLEARIGTNALERVNSTSLTLGDYESFKDAARQTLRGISKRLYPISEQPVIGIINRFNSFFETWKRFPAFSLNRSRPIL